MSRTYARMLLEGLDASPQRDRLLDVLDNPGAHVHTWDALQACCTFDGAINLGIMEAHEGLGLGPRCDVAQGPCSCGSVHAIVLQ